MSVAAHDAGDARAGSELYVVISERVFRPLAVLGFALRGQILPQRAAECDVDDLLAVADAQQRQT
jgi:hypothetical protein